MKRKNLDIKQFYSSVKTFFKNLNYVCECTFAISQKIKSNAKLMENIKRTREKIRENIIFKYTLQMTNFDKKKKIKSYRQ